MAICKIISVPCAYNEKKNDYNMSDRIERSMPVIILGGARDYHAIDWYRSLKKACPERKIVFLTDSVDGEGFCNILNENDEINHLMVIDGVLFPFSSSVSNIWRNIVKLVALPFQIYYLRRFMNRYDGAVVHAHPMYYMFLCWAAGVGAGVTPQGSEILVRPHKNIIYKHFLIKSLRAASFVTVDSYRMKQSIFELSGVNATVVQNGIDISKIRAVSDSIDKRYRICSVRGFAPLYRIHEVVDSRNRSSVKVPITYVYPFTDSRYYREVKAKMISEDEVLGRLDKLELYKVLSESLLTISIPESDSSPRSVYEAIFCGSCVAVTGNEYLDALPSCMLKRIFVVDLSDRSWFSKALQFAKHFALTPYIPSSEAIETFDQNISLRKASKKLYQISTIR